MHPLAKDIAKLVIDRAQDAYVAVAKAAGAIDFPVPPNSNMRRTSSSWVRHYYDSGITTGLPIVTAASLAGLDFSASLKVLDFGAGVGRQVRYFHQRHPDVSLFACDIERSHMEWLAKAYPDVEAHTSAYLPPLKYPNGFFDLVYSVSIFSHITEEHAKAWLDEFARIVRPGGVACLTTLGFTADRMEKPSAGRREALLSLGRFHVDYDFVPAAKARSEKATLLKQSDMFAAYDVSYGRTFLTPAYIRERWPSAQWEVVGISEGVIDTLQDLAVLKRTEAQ